MARASANIGSEPFAGFVEFVMKPYFSWLPGSLVAWAALHDVVEFVGGIFLAAGFLTRYVAAALSGTMVSHRRRRPSGGRGEGGPGGAGAGAPEARQSPSLAHKLSFLSHATPNPKESRQDGSKRLKKTIFQKRRPLVKNHAFEPARISSIVFVCVSR
jgi:hypothetical protein